MADDIDRLQERDAVLQQALEQYRKPTVVPTGRCLNCEEPLLPGVAYCDADCRDDHEKREHLERQRPR